MSINIFFRYVYKHQLSYSFIMITVLYVFFEAPFLSSEYELFRRQSTVSYLCNYIVNDIQIYDYIRGKTTMSTKQLLEIKTNFRVASRYKVNIQKSITILILSKIGISNFKNITYRGTLNMKSLGIKLKICTEFICRSH